MRPIVLTILDGWGYSPQKVGNAIMNARKPNIDAIQANYPSVLLQASGKAVGMTWGEAGNSEVGHLTLGAGRVISQYLNRINKAIESGEFYDNPAFAGAIDHVRKNNSKLHIAGILTSGSVHSYFSHVPALIELAKRSGLKDVKLHLFTDGKDSGQKEAASLLAKLESYLENSSVKLATIMGRDFPMERNENWGLTEKAYNFLTGREEGEKVDDIIKKLEEYYAQDIHDHKIPLLVLDPSGFIADNDALIFFNFREDSMRQITRAFVEDEFSFFPRQKVQNLFAVEMVEYVINPNIKVAFPVPLVKNCLAEVLSTYGKKQLHIAETEKYAHITYFFNCLQNSFPGEDDVFIKSVRHPENDPEMMATEITDKAIEEMAKDTYEFIAINYANSDLLAHLGNLEKAVRGIEHVDSCIGRLKDAIFEKGGILIITADHGNAESLTYKSGEPESRHNISPVPFYLVVKEYERPRSEDEIKQNFSETKGLIADVAPTILQIMGIPQPEEMTGESLFKVLG